MDQIVGIIWDVAKCLCGCAYEQAAYICDLEENLQSLTKKWEDLHSMRQDMQEQVDEAENTGEKKRSHQVNTWLQQIKGIEETIEDVQVQGAQEIQNKCLSKCCPKNCVSSYKLGKNVVKMLKNVDELATTGKRFNKEVEIAHKILARPVEMPLDETVGLNLMFARPVEVPLDETVGLNLMFARPVEMPLDETVGLNLMFEKVWNSTEADNIGVIGLYGMGGAGKTTLLKRINNQFREKRPDFDVVMWLVVSRDHNLDKIMDDIRTKVGIADEIWNHYKSQDDRVAKIYQVLKHKKFVLLLDDIWERLDLKMVGVPHPKETNFQSKVLFTTRSKDVCAKMQAQTKFKIECLMEKEAFELFCMKVGEETLSSHPNIPKLAREMAAECKGLPLALIVVGSAMAGVTDFRAWEQSKNNLSSSPWTASDLEKNVFSILKFSYDKLPDEIHKNCFLSCALFPEDYEISVLKLIDKWIGEGFLGKDRRKSTMDDMYGHGESVIEKLKLSSLLESVEDDFFRGKVKMHDMIRDMALWLVHDQDRSKNKTLVQREALAVSQEDDAENWRVVERISVIECDDWHIPAVTCPNLISLAFASSGKYKITGLRNIQRMSRLKVLELSVDTATLELSAEIGGLIHLEYLCLIGPMSTSNFPRELKKLENLKIFSLAISINGDLSVIPLEVISGLKHLRVLRFHTHSMRSREAERAFLQNLESLLNLEELHIQIMTENGLVELFSSTRLQRCMRSLIVVDMYLLRNDMTQVFDHLSRMRNLQLIDFLDLGASVASVKEDSSIFYTCHLSKLRILKFSKCDSIVHLTCLKHAPLLQLLQIDNCESIEEVIKEGTKDDKESVDKIFPCLIELHLSNLSNLWSIHKTALPFPFLRSIEISDCPSLKRLPFNFNSAKDNLKHIEFKGSQDWWDNLEWEDLAIKDKFQSKFRCSKERRRKLNRMDTPALGKITQPRWFY